MVATSRVDVIVEPEMTSVGDGAHAGLQCFGKFRTRGFRTGTDVEDDNDICRDHIGGARRDRDAADGCDHFALCFARQRFAEQHRFRGARERVTPQHHRHGAGVAGFAQEFDVEISLPDDRHYNAERLTAGFQHRTLLDVDFDIGGCFIAGIRGGRDRVRRSAVGLDGVAERDAVAVRQREPFRS